ncbi:MAG: Re/Si-specific NAD(P)(+) transhydrogenase subunit alpha [Acidobacteriota bacterium]
MKIAVPRELHPEERRVPIIPPGVEKLVKDGAEVEIEAGMGIGSGYRDEDYSGAGASISTDRQQLLSWADLVLRLRKPPLEEVDWLKEGGIHVSFLDPFNETELVDQLARRGISAISMEMIPRTTRAQKMDALSSQASLAGYVAVIIAAEALDKVLPMMTTPAGTIAPSRVFVIGAGVAGLQAIATAKRLGARVEAFDTRPVVEEQVSSLGAKFVKIDLGATGEAEGGYAKALTEEQLRRQREGMARHCAQADVVITTAQLFGCKAPRIVTSNMISGMKKGSVIVDLAVESGGNVEGSVPDQVVERDGVKIVGATNLPSRVPVDASQMYSSNLVSLVDHFWDREQKQLVLRMEDEILKGCLITHAGEICNEMLLSVAKG